MSKHYIKEEVLTQVGDAKVVARNWIEFDDNADGNTPVFQITSNHAELSVYVKSDEVIRSYMGGEALDHDLGPVEKSMKIWEFMLAVLVKDELPATLESYRKKEINKHNSHIVFSLEQLLKREKKTGKIYMGCLRAPKFPYINSTEVFNLMCKTIDGRKAKVS